MRNIDPRPSLGPNTRAKLSSKTQEILLTVGRKEKVARARTVYSSSRDARWFKPIVDALRKLSGNGELCMYCSANEPSQLEHYRPISSFPELAMNYENYLWTCDICNRSYKGDSFPLDAEGNAQIVNPIDDDVWEYFFIDSTFGRLIPRVDPHTRLPLARSSATCDVVGIDRQNVQDRRRARLGNVRRSVLGILEDFELGRISRQDVEVAIEEIINEPLQVDVADYFLRGPGRAVEPFSHLLAIVRDA